MDELTLTLLKDRVQLYLDALNALSLKGVDLNVAAVIQQEAQRLVELVKDKEEPPPSE